MVVSTFAAATPIPHDALIVVLDEAFTEVCLCGKIVESAVLSLDKPNFRFDVARYNVTPDSVSPAFPKAS